jgi:rhodanese-related sulfurtransferase
VTPEAWRLSLSELAENSHSISNGRRVVLCCSTGVRAHRAAQLLAERGVRDLAVVALALG